MGGREGRAQRAVSGQSGLASDDELLFDLEREDGKEFLIQSAIASDMN